MGTYMDINKDTIIYLIAPPNYASGGPELLHQLCHVLRNKGIEAQMFYYNDSDPWGTKYTEPKHEKFSKYNTVTAESIIDEPSNIVIVPEMITIPFWYIHKAKKCIWWLSFSNFFLREGHFDRVSRAGIIKRRVKKVLNRQKYPMSISEIRAQDILHLSQCHYITSMLDKYGVLNVPFLSDYIDDSYMEYSEDYLANTASERENIILYNPKRNHEVILKLMPLMPEVQFIALENMTVEQLKEVMLKAKVYLDFGAHGGKDRLPRESALCGCCVVTNMRGSAGFFDDVPIPSEFKYSLDGGVDYHKLADNISRLVQNYDVFSQKYSYYRGFIRGEKDTFLKDVNKIFD